MDDLDMQTPDIRWQLAAENAGIGIWDYTLDGDYYFFSREWYIMRGRNPDEPEATTNHGHWLDLIHPEDQTHARAQADLLHAGKIEEVNFEYRIPHEDGHWIWILVRGRASNWDAAGQPIRFIGTDTDVTTLKEAQDKVLSLTDNQMRMNIAAESAEQGIWDINFQTQTRTYSNAWRTMRGHAPDSDYGNDREEWIRDIHPDDVGTLLGKKRVVNPKGDAALIKSQYRHKTKDGRWIWILSRGKVVEWMPDGGPARIIGTDTDVTDIKEAERDLERATNTLELAISASNAGVWESNHINEQAIWDKRTCEIFGVDPDSPMISPAKFKSCIHPDDLHIVETGADAPSERGEDFALEYRIIHPTAGIRFLRSRARYHEKGARHVGIIWDVTKSRERKFALQSTNDLLDEVMERMEQGLVVFHGDDLMQATITMANPQFMQLVGAPREFQDPDLTFAQYLEYIRDHWTSVDTEDHDIMTYGTLVTKGQPLRTVFTLPSGRTLRVTGTPMGDDARVVTYTDITDIAESERERAKLAENLSHVQRLQVVGQLTGGVAHDFNNLLAVVSGNAELLEMELGEENESLAYIIQAAKRGAELTQQLLAFSRKQTLQPTAVNMAAMLNRLQGLLRRTLEDNVTVNVIPNPGLWLCKTDPGQIENAIINLAVNARDAMPGGGALTISARNIVQDTSFIVDNDEVKAGEYVCISVADTGTGMPDDVIARAFEPFFTTKEVGQGSGLGLSMVFGFAKQSKGHVQIESALGTGTQVHLYLPRAVDAVDHAPAPRPAIMRGAAQRIMLVEDDHSVRNMVTRALGQIGYVVQPFDSAVAAWDAISADGFAADLLLTDVVMPGGMNGFELGGKVRDIAPNINIIYMSGHTEDLLPPRDITDDQFDLLSKPFSIQELAARIAARFGMEE